MNGDQMHGSIFVFLKRFVESRFDFSTWMQITESTCINRTAYHMHEMYPVDELNKVVQAVSVRSGLSRHQVLEQFGSFLVPDLLLIFKRFVNPAWGTFEMIQHTEQYLHGAARQQYSQINPPRLFVTRVNKNLLIVDYYSRRRMASIAIGIIKGIASHFGDLPKLRVWAATPLDAERVQIRVEQQEE